MGGAPFLENEYNCTNWYFFRKELRSPFNQVITLDFTVYDCLKNTLTVHHVVTLTLTFYPILLSIILRLIIIPSYIRYPLHFRIISILFPLFSELLIFPFMHPSICLKIFMVFSKTAFPENHIRVDLSHYSKRVLCKIFMGISRTPLNKLSMATLCLKRWKML